MSDQENYFNIDYPGYSPLEIVLNDSEDFLKVRETLSRIGVASKKDKVLYQSCHILHKKGRYFITHFKELFALDGKEADFQDNDLQRRNSIAKLLQDWGLVEIVSEVDIQLVAVVITSSPEPTPNIFIAIYRASVPFATEMQCLAPYFNLKLFSKSFTCLPLIKEVSFITVDIASSISSFNNTY